MHKIKPSEILVILRYGNVEEAKKLSKFCGNFTHTVVRENDLALYAIAERADMIQMTPQAIDDIMRDYGNTISIPLLARCFQTYTSQNQQPPALSESVSLKCRIDLLQFLLDNHQPISWGTVIEAIKRDRLDVFQWLENNVPCKVFHSFNFRGKATTFEIQKYLYSKGYVPTENDYLQAKRMNDQQYLIWLYSIGCPGAEQVITTAQIENMIKKDLKSEDYSLLAQLFNEKKIPSMAICREDQLYVQFTSFVKYLTDHERVLVFEYMSINATDLLSDLYISLADNSLESSFLESTRRDETTMCQIYLDCSGTYRDKLQPFMNWNLVMWNELKTIRGLTTHDVDTLWAKYSDKIRTLTISGNIADWAVLKECGPTSDQIYAFLSTMMAF
jgi:hypothetical protein